MELFLKKLFFFSLLAILFYSGGIFVIGNYAPLKIKKNAIYLKNGYGNTQNRILDANNISKTDILIIGSSHAYRGIDPRIFAEHNFSSFNLGSSSQTPIQTKLLLKEYLDTLAPKLVIYVISPLSFQSDGIESTTDFIWNIPSFNLNVLKLSIRTQNIKVYNTYLVSALNNLVFNQSMNIQSISNGNDFYISQTGFVEKTLKYYDPIEEKKILFELDEVQEKAFKDNIAYIKRMQTKIILIRAPVTKARNESYSNYKEMKEYFNSFENYIDYNLKLKLQDSIHFYDSNHLNQKGVRIFNEALIKDLLNERT
tara:strand:+ start:839 stop:1771 length:933 start_codon:yes stop_codon:yes gene_type:complete